MKTFTSLFILVIMTAAASAFLPHVPMRGSSIPSFQSGTGQHLKRRIESTQRIPVPVQRQRRSVGVVQTMGLFGLGIPEIAVILVAVGFVLGPGKLAKIARGTAEMTNEFKAELKKVPAEFEKGLDEGEQNSRSRKAKPMKKVSSDEFKAELKKVPAEFEKGLDE